MTRPNDMSLLAMLVGLLVATVLAWGYAETQPWLPLVLSLAGYVTGALHLHELRVARYAASYGPVLEPRAQLANSKKLAAWCFVSVFAAMAMFASIGVYKFLTKDGTVEPQRPVSTGPLTPRDSMDELAKQVASLTAAIRAMPASAEVLPPPVTGPAWPPPGAQVIVPESVRWLTALVSAAVSVLIAWPLLSTMVASRRGAAALTLIAAATVGTVNFRLFDKFSLERLLDCGPKGCTLQIGGDAPPLGLQVLAPSPAFAVGTSRVGEAGLGCLGSHNSTEAWERWERAWMESWRTRSKPSTADVVVLIGSADRQALGGALQRSFDSNAGLAQARAEAVRERLMKATASLPDEHHRLQPRRVLVLNSGPANTGTPLQSAGPACDDEGLRDDRRVQVWVQSTVAK